MDFVFNHTSAPGNFSSGGMTGYTDAAWSNPLPDPYPGERKHVRIQGAFDAGINIRTSPLIGNEYILQQLNTGPSSLDYSFDLQAGKSFYLYVWPKLAAPVSIPTNTWSINATAHVLPFVPEVSLGDVTLKEGVASTLTPTVVGIPTAWSAHTLPAGMSINAATGVISGTPSGVGTYTVSIAATNDGGAGYGTVTITVIPGAPSVTDGQSFSGQVGVAFSHAVVKTGADATSWSAASLPPGLSINSATGQITGIPTSSGSYAPTVTAANSSGSNSKTVAITIAVAVLSIPAGQTFSGQVTQAFSQAVATIGNPATSWSATGLPAGLSINSATGVISGTPTTAGSSTVSVTATNSTDSATATLAVAVAERPAPVVSAGQSLYAQAGIAFSQAVAATGSPTAWSATGLPAGLSVNSSTGIISGTPTTAGTSSVVVTATNAGGAGAAYVSIAVAADPTPRLVGRNFMGRVGDFFQASMDYTGTPTSWSATGLPSGLTINAVTGLISGTPTADGTSAVSVTATNSHGSDTQAASFVVVAATVPVAVPVITTTTSVLGYKQWEKWEYQPFATNFPILWECSNLPAGLSINSVTGKISGAATSAGVFVCGLKASNGVGTSAPLVLTIGIDPASAALTNSGYEVKINVQTREIEFIAPSGGSSQTVSKTVTDAGSSTTTTGSQTVGATAPNLFAKITDSLLLWIAFQKDGVNLDLDIGSLAIAIKEFNPDGRLVLGNTWKKFGSGTGAYYGLYAAVSGADLASALSNYESDSGTAFDGLADIQWTEANPDHATFGPENFQFTTRDFKATLARGEE